MKKMKNKCDICHSEEKQLYKVTVPTPATISAYGGNCIPIIKLGPKLDFKEQDICYKCAERIMKSLIMMQFMKE